MAFSTVSSVVEMIISCFVCGLVHEKFEQIYAVLDKWNSIDLSECDYKQWLMFKNVNRENRFGFTIGGFVSLRKTTLISVRILRIFSVLYTNYSYSSQIFSFMLNYTVIILQTIK